MSLKTNAAQSESKSKPRLSKCIAILHLGKVYAPLETLFVSQEEDPDPPKEKPFECEVCDKGFTVKRSLKRHLQMHTRELSYTCECGKRYSRMADLRLHVNTHHVTFETIQRTALERQTLLTHNPMELPHRCELCGKGFQRKGVMKRHIIVHTRERPYVCDICGKAFGQKPQLTVHLRFHSGERPFSCSDCEKRFASKSYLKQHRRIHGNGDLLCLHCHFRAASSDSLRLHLQKVHSREHFCSLCFRGFPLLWELQKHNEMLHSVKKETDVEEDEESKSKQSPTAQLSDDKATVSSPSFKCKQEPLDVD